MTFKLRERSIYRDIFNESENPFDSAALLTNPLYLPREYEPVDDDDDDEVEEVEDEDIDAPLLSLSISMLHSISVSATAFTAAVTNASILSQYEKKEWSGSVFSTNVSLHRQSVIPKAISKSYGNKSPDNNDKSSMYCKQLNFPFKRLELIDCVETKRFGTCVG